jgi:hypothetical protein
MQYQKITTIEELVDLGTGIACDLDETCSWTVYHYIDILKNKFGNPENLSTLDMVEKYQYVQSVPYYRTPEINEWIEEMIHSNELQPELPLIPNIQDYIHKVNKTMPIKCYLTLRPESVVDGTREWLKQHQFPDATVFAKPDHIDRLEGNKWKANILKQAYPTIKGIIDDNQGIIEELGKDYQGKLFLFGHKSSPNGASFVVPCQDWNKVYGEIKDIYNKS